MCIRLILLTLTAFLCGGTRTVYSQIAFSTLAQVTPGSLVVVGYDAPDSYVIADEFIPNASYDLTSVDLIIEKDTGAGNSPLVLQILSSDSGKPGAVLATSTLATTNLPTNVDTQVRFILSGNIPVQKGVPYFVSLTSSTSNYAWASSSDSSLPEYYTIDGGAWGGPDEPIEAFQINGTEIIDAPTITSATVASGTYGTVFGGYTIVATPLPTRFNATGLPTGLSINTSTGVISGTPTQSGTFSVSLSATNTTGTGTATLTLTINKASQTITLPALNILSYPSSPITLSETASSGLALSFSLVSGPASISGANQNILNLTGTGTVVIQASQGGNANYLPATSVNQSFTVAAPVAFTGNPTATPENDGIPNLLKYLFDIDPSSPMNATDYAALPTLGTTTSGGTDYLTLTYRQYALATGITIHVQTSPDLKTWTTQSSAVISQVSTNSNTGDPIMQAQFPVSATTEFMRLNVTSP